MVHKEIHRLRMVHKKHTVHMRHRKHRLLLVHGRWSYTGCVPYLQLRKTLYQLETCRIDSTSDFEIVCARLLSLQPTVSCPTPCDKIFCLCPIVGVLGLHSKVRFGHVGAAGVKAFAHEFQAHLLRLEELGDCPQWRRPVPLQCQSQRM